jgi:hypothetical protein
MIGFAKRLIAGSQSISPGLLRKRACSVHQTPSFPHVFSGNPGETRTGPPIEAFGGDEFGSRHSGLSIHRSLLGVVHRVKPYVFSTSGLCKLMGLLSMKFRMFVIASS